MPEVIICTKITYSVAICNVYPVTGRVSWPHSRVNICLISYDGGMPVHSKKDTYNANKTRICKKGILGH